MEAAADVVVVMILLLITVVGGLTEQIVFLRVLGRPCGEEENEHKKS